MTDWTKGVPEPRDDEHAGGAKDTEGPTRAHRGAGPVDWTSFADGTKADVNTGSGQDQDQDHDRGGVAAESHPGTDPYLSAYPGVEASGDDDFGEDDSAKQPMDARKRSIIFFSALGALAVVAVGGTFVWTSLKDDGADQTTAAPAAQESSLEASDDQDTAAGEDGSTGADKATDKGTSDASAEQVSTPARGSDKAPDPDASVAAVFGACANPGKSVEVIASAKSPRGVLAEFEKAYFAHDAEAIPGLLTPESSMQKEDWPEVLSQIDASSTYCLRMDPVAGQSDVPYFLDVTADGETVSYEGTAETEEKDGRWFIKEIRGEA